MLGPVVVSCVTDGKPDTRFLALPPWIVCLWSWSSGGRLACTTPNELHPTVKRTHIRAARDHVSPPTLHVSHAHTHTHTPPHHRLSPAQPRSHGTHDARPNRARGVQACSSNAACTVAPTYETKANPRHSTKLADPLALLPFPVAPSVLQLVSSCCGTPRRARLRACSRTPVVAPSLGKGRG